MGFRTTGIGVLAGALAVPALAVAAAQARPPQITIAQERTGASPIVAGSGQQTQFTVTVTDEGSGFWDLNGRLDDGLEIGQITTSTDKIQCQKVSATIYTCSASYIGGSDAGVLNGGGVSGTITVTASAIAQVRPGTLQSCAGLALLTFAPDSATSQDYTGCLGDRVAAAEDVYASVEVINDADLVLSGSGGGKVDPGARTEATWTVKNEGPSSASGPVKIAATLPAGVSFVSGSAPWVCAATGQLVECEYEPRLALVWETNLLDPGRTASALTWALDTAKPAKVGQYRIDALASSATTDSKPGSNKASVLIDVTPVDLAVSKSAATPVLVGDEAQWTITVDNVGTIDDAGVMTVSDMLPAGAELKSVEPGWECTADGQKITCSRASLAKGASATLVLLTSMTQRGSATNAVNVATTSYEQNTANNSSQATVRVNRAAQTAKALPASPTRVKAGKTKQGQKLRTRVICRPKKFAAAGEVAFCKVTRRAGEVRIQVVGSKTMKVTVIQRAKATPRYKRFVQRKTYIVKP